MTYEPFKCPDCSVWWRGETHKCPPVSYATSTVTYTGPFGPYTATCGYCKEKIYSKMTHKCKPMFDEFVKKNKKGYHPHDPEDGSTKWNT